MVLFPDVATVRAAMAPMQPFQFAPDDAAYLQWLAENPGGYVLTSNRSLTPRHTVIHRTTCTLIREHRSGGQYGGFTERSYLKVFGEDIPSLVDWLRQARPDGQWRPHSCVEHAGIETAPHPITCFSIGATYTKADIYRLCQVPEDKQDGSWSTGYTYWNGAWFLFCNVGIAGRTGHDYANRFAGDELIWYGKTGSHAEQPSIQAMLDGSTDVLVFYRENDRDPFTFHGRAKATGAPENGPPVCIVWTFGETDAVRPETLPQEITDTGKTYAEGAVKRIWVDAYERNPLARRACIQRYGFVCVVCGFDFKRHYGAIGAEFIHVHHLRPIAQAGGSYMLDPVNDLRPVCPNCHAMLHRTNPPMSVEELKDHWRLAHLDEEDQSALNTVSHT